MKLAKHVTQACLRTANAPGRRRFLSDPATQEAFEAQRDELTALQGQTAYWHGTGAYQYATRGSKYGEVDHDTVVDILQSLLDRGLAPQHDLLAERFHLEGQTDSVSLTQRRLYARVYAALYSYDGDDAPLQYQYGHRAFWWFYFGKSMVFHALKDWAFVKEEARRVIDRLLHTDPEFQAQRARIREKAWLWTRTIRSDGKYSAPVLDNIMTGCTSDIPGNFPLIVGVKHNGFEEIPIWRPVATYEARSAEPIPPSRWSYVEVPMTKIQTTREKLGQAGLDIPVIPIEFAELICRDMPLDELTRPHDGW